MRKITVLSLLLTAATAPGADWPRYLGPNRDASTPETELIKSFPEGGPKVLWTARLGAGWGGPAVRDGKVYLLDRQDGEDILRVWDLESGKELDSKKYRAPGKISHEGSRSTPTVDEKLVFTVGEHGRLVCWDRADLRPVWDRRLLEDFGGKLPRWGVAQSPLMVGDLLIVAPQGKKAGVVALDKARGEIRWRSRPVGPMDYTSPVYAEIAGVPQVIIVSKSGTASVALEDGKLLWTHSYKDRNAIPSPLVLEDGKVFFTSGYGAGSELIEVTEDAGRWSVKSLTSNPMGSQITAPIYYDKHLYVLCNAKKGDNGLVCFDMQLRPQWQTGRRPWLDRGGMLLTGNGLIYSMDGRSGELRIIQPDPEGYRELGKAKLLEGREIWAPLALSNGKLLIRDKRQLKCVDVSAE